MARSAPLALAILPFLIGCGSTRAADALSPSIEVQIKELVPNLSVTFEPAQADTSGPYAVHRFYYGQAPSWPYGEGFAVASKTAGTVLWVYLHHGDYPPHKIRWADFDGDQKLDIFFYAGFEDVSTTHVYVNRIAQERFGLAQFVQGYENTEVYSLVLDFDDDGRPELLEPEPYPDEFDACAQEFSKLEVGYPGIREEYRRLAGAFDAFNARFGVPDEEYVSLNLFERVQIQTVGKDAPPPLAVDHLRWRLRVLRDLRASVSSSCRPRVDLTIKYLEKAVN